MHEYSSMAEIVSGADWGVITFTSKLISVSIFLKDEMSFISSEINKTGAFFVIFV